VLAVDGGQSGIRVCHSRVGRSTEVEGISRLEGDTVGAVVEAIAAAWRELEEPAIERAVLGLTTAPTDEATRERLCLGLSELLGVPEVWLADDAVTAHAGALGGGWGVSVTVGTGVACLAVPMDGDAGLIGGHGYLLGDEGGGYWIGREGIRAVLRARDGRGPETRLERPAAKHFGGLEDLGDRLHSSDRPVNTIARFAPAVLTAAEADDAVAVSIIEDAVAELVALIAAGCRLAAPHADPVPVALGGRLVAEGGLRRRLETAIDSSLPRALLQSAQGTPLDGALLLGAADGTGTYDGLIYAWRAAA
jgi:N-acetylglucosamine kinase-like BadF-type ATPase